MLDHRRSPVFLKYIAKALKNTIVKQHQQTTGDGFEMRTTHALPPVGTFFRPTIVEDIQNGTPTLPRKRLEAF